MTNGDHRQNDALILQALESLGKRFDFYDQRLESFRTEWAEKVERLICNEGAVKKLQEDVQTLKEEHDPQKKKENNYAFVAALLAGLNIVQILWMTFIQPIMTKGKPHP